MRWIALPSCGDRWGVRDTMNNHWLTDADGLTVEFPDSYGAVRQAELKNKGQ